jgi:thioredoxin 1
MVRAQALFSRKWLGEVPVFGLGQSGPVAVTDANFAQVQAAPKAVVDFWIPTCPPCVAYKPVFEEVATQSPGILMATANTNDAPAVSGQYSIAATPTTIFFVNGQEVNRVEGGMSKAGLQAEMAKAFGGGAVAPTPGAPARDGGPGLMGIVLGGMALAGLAAGAFYLLGKKK